MRYIHNHKNCAFSLVRAKRLRSFQLTPQMQTHQQLQRSPRDEAGIGEEARSALAAMLNSRTFVFSQSTAVTLSQLCSDGI